MQAILGAKKVHIHSVFHRCKTSICSSRISPNGVTQAEESGSFGGFGLVFQIPPAAGTIWQGIMMAGPATLTDVSSLLGLWPRLLRQNSFFLLSPPTSLRVGVGLSHHFILFGNYNDTSQHPWPPNPYRLDHSPWPKLVYLRGHAPLLKHTFLSLSLIHI